MRFSSRGDLATSCSLWRGTCHSSRQKYVVVASHPPVPFTRRLDFQPDEPTPSLPSRIRTGVIEIAKLRAFTFLCLFIRLNTIATVRQAVSRNAHALALGRRLRQGSVGARRRWKAARPRVRPGKYFFALRCLQPFHTHSQLVSQSFASSPPRSALAPIAITTRRPTPSEGSSQE